MRRKVYPIIDSVFLAGSLNGNPPTKISPPAQIAVQGRNSLVKARHHTACNHSLQPDFAFVKSRFPYENLVNITFPLADITSTSGKSEQAALAARLTQFGVSLAVSILTIRLRSRIFHFPRKEEYSQNK